MLHGIIILHNDVKEKESLFFDAVQVVKSPEIPIAKDLFCDEYVDIVASEKNGNETIRMEDVCRAEFGETIEASFMPALEKYGLWLSRYNKGERKGELRPVKDSAYFDKIQGYDPTNVYGGDKEVTSDVFKNSKIPFDLLREVTATHIELWCEYAIATKGVVALRISRSLAKKINAYFEANLDKNPIPKDLPLSKVVAHLETIIYRLFYRNFPIPRLKYKATEGFDALRKWVKDKMAELGVSALCDDPTVLLRPPNSVDDLLFNKIFPI